MYGLLLENLAAFIKIQWGESKWDSVRKHAGVDSVSFSVHHVYAETLIPRLAKSACKVLDITEQAFFEAMGVYFVEFVGQYGYDQVLTVLGRHMRDFLNGLDSLHEYLKFSYPRMRAPSFFCENETADGLMLHYRSKRRGFVYYSMGQIKQVAKHFYNMDCDISVSSEELDGDTMHVIFQLRFDNRAYSEAQSIMSLIREERQLPVRASMIFEIFPFCLAFCPGMVIRHTGHSLLAILKDLIGQCVTQAFELTRPLISFNFSTILERRNNVFELLTTAPLRYDEVVSEDMEEDDDASNLRLRGQMLFMEEWNMILYLAAPVMPDLDGLTSTGLYLNDLSLHDCSRDLILVGTQQQAELKLALDQEQHKSRKLEDSMKKLDAEMKRTDELLYQMIPKAVADRIRRGENLVDTCEVFETVSILFSDVVTFTEICSRITPMQVVSMLNHMYSLFDQLTERNGVYKVETIGDAYMVVSGAPDYDVNHAERICDMALDMIDASAGIRDPSQANEPTKDKEHVRLRVGVHSGTVVAGVVGLKMPRYCLFGDTVNTASRLESTSEAGRVQISQATKDLLPGTYATEYRGEVAMKGKGDMKTYWLLGRRERVPLSELRCNSFSWAEPTINLSSSANEGPGVLLRSNSVGSSITDSLNVTELQGNDGRRQTRSRSWSQMGDDKNSVESSNPGHMPMHVQQHTIESRDMDAAKRACASIMTRSKSEDSMKADLAATTKSTSSSAKTTPDRPPTPTVTFKEPLTTSSTDQNIPPDPVQPVTVAVEITQVAKTVTPTASEKPVPATPVPTPKPSVPSDEKPVISIETKKVADLPQPPTATKENVSDETGAVPVQEVETKLTEPDTSKPMLSATKREGEGALNQTQENFLISKATLNNSEQASTVRGPQSVNNTRSSTVSGETASGNSSKDDRSRDPLLKRLRENKVALLTSEAMAQLGCSGFSAKQKEVISTTCDLL